MKKVLYIFLILSLVSVTQFANAGVAEMRALRAEGRFVGVKKAIVSLVKDGKTPVALEIELIRNKWFEEIDGQIDGTLERDFDQVTVGRDGQRDNLFRTVERHEIVDVFTDACGSTIYEALIPSVRGFEFDRFITLIDHRTRMCDDRIIAGWEAELIDETVEGSVLEMAGQPH